MAGNNDKAQRKALRDALTSLGIDGNFLELIDAAVRGDWSIQEFTVRLTKTEAFRNKFPGLIQNGNLNPDLVGGRDVGISASSLASAIRAYETAWKGYTEIAKNYGYGGIGRDKLALLMRNGVSPDEFGTRLQATASSASRTISRWRCARCRCASSRRCRASRWSGSRSRTRTARPSTSAT